MKQRSEYGDAFMSTEWATCMLVLSTGVMLVADVLDTFKGASFMYIVDLFAGNAMLVFTAIA